MLEYRVIDESDESVFDQWQSDEARVVMGGRMPHGTFASLMNLSRARTHQTFMAMDKDTSIGFVDMDVRGRAIQLSFYVAPKLRGKGYGKAIIAMTVDYAKQHGYSSLLVEIENDRGASQHILERYGFNLKDISGGRAHYQKSV